MSGAGGPGLVGRAGGVVMGAIDSTTAGGTGAVHLAGGAVGSGAMASTGRGIFFLTGWGGAGCGLGFSGGA